MQVGYRFRFYPTPEQEKILSRTFGCVRYVYNWALRMRTDAWHEGKRVNYNATSSALTELKKAKETEWLNEVSSVPVQQSLRHLQTAFANFFEKRAAYPAFRRKGQKQSAEYTRSGFKWEAANRNLSIARLGRLKVKWSREFSSEPTTVTLSKDPAGRYFVSLRLDEPVKKLPQASASVGVDLGINRTMTLSDGTRFGNPRYTAKYSARLRALQRRLSRKERGSANWRKAKRKVARLHAKIGDCRKDFTHKATTQVVRENQAIYLEDLSVRNLMANRCLAKAIGDCGWFEITRQFAYKSGWHGRTMVQIDRFFPSSKRCSCCGHIVKEMPLEVRRWTCPECSTEHDRDENAAKNILAAGQAVAASGGTVRPKRVSTRVGKSRRRKNRPEVFSAS